MAAPPHKLASFFLLLTVMRCMYPANNGVRTLSCISAMRTYGIHTSLIHSHEEQRRLRSLKGLLSSKETALNTRGRCKLHCQKKYCTGEAKGKGRKHLQIDWCANSLENIFKRSPVLFNYMEAKRADSVWLLTSKWICKECVLLCKLARETFCIYVT